MTKANYRVVYVMRRRRSGGVETWLGYDDDGKHLWRPGKWRPSHGAVADPLEEWNPNADAGEYLVPIITKKRRRS